MRATNGWHADFGDPLLLVDNNYLGYLTGAKYNFDRMKTVKCLAQTGVGLRHNYEVGILPPMILELLGISKVNCSATPSAAENATGQEIVLKLFKDAGDEFLASPRLEPGPIRESYLKRYERLNNQGRKFFYDVIGPQCFRRDAKLRFSEALAWNYVLRFDYNKIIRSKIDAYFCQLLGMEDDPEFSRLRIISRVWATKVDKKQFKEDEIQSINGALGLKPQKDNLDCDLIHAALFGYNGPRAVVICTCDHPNAVKWRYRLYKSVVKEVISSMTKLSKFPIFIKSIVICVDRYGNVVEEIRTWEEPDLEVVLRAN